jgi:predicted phosphoadenosine phosphosulfate sulfurtransferase
MVSTKKQEKKTCCLVGIRTQESLNRWRAIHSDKNTNKCKKSQLHKKKMYDNVYNAYHLIGKQVMHGWQIINLIGLIINYMMFSSLV